MTAIADSDGIVTGTFTIPADTFRSGIKTVHFEGAGGSFSDVNFFGEGFLETRTFQEQTTVSSAYGPYPWPIGVDPLAQTFTISSQDFTEITAAEVFISAKHGSQPIYVQVRETQVGFPTRVILAQAFLAADDIVADDWNKFTFIVPFTAAKDTEYALVVICENATSSVKIAELGKFDSDAQQWITSQPYQIGVLLSSANASSWTVHQDRDMAFKIIASSYSIPAQVIDLGVVAISGATDLLLLSTTNQPAPDAGVSFNVTLPDNTVIAASSGQSIRLKAGQQTGDVRVVATVHANSSQSGILAPGTQIIPGIVQSTADYVTPAISARALGADINILFDGIIPAGAGVKVFVSDGSVISWDEIISPDAGYPIPINDGLSEFKYSLEDFTAATIRVKLELSGDIDARPFIYNLRVSTL